MKHFAFALLLILAAAQSIHADDWPQWMGPKRDNVWRETGLLEIVPRRRAARRVANPDRRRLRRARRRRRQGVRHRLCHEDNVKVDNFDRNEFTGIERVLCLNAETGRGNLASTSIR